MGDEFVEAGVSRIEKFEFYASLAEVQSLLEC